MAEECLDRMLRHAQLVALGSIPEILTELSRDALAITRAPRAFTSCIPPGHSWQHGIHLASTCDSHRDATPATRSALFAIHRILAMRRGTSTIERGDDTAAIFAGLECGAEVGTLAAIPIVHRTGKLWGELVLIGAERIDARIAELAQIASIALENAQRLSFARRDQDRLLLLAEATDDALYDWDFDAPAFWWGGGILKLQGSSSEPIEHTAAWKLGRIHPLDIERVRASLHAARFSKATNWQAEYRFRRQDDTYVDVEDRGYFLRDTDNRAYRMIGAMRDVSTMKSLLAREQQARAEAESASRTKDEFLAMLGHELRNPLAPIITGLQLVRLRGGVNVDKELMVLERQAQHLIRLVDDLLDISRIAHGKIELRRERLEVATAIAAAIETTSPLIESRAHTLEIDVPARGLEVFADRARLAQAISNLLTNAAKYTEPGGRISIFAQREADAVVVTVRDTGIGIAPEMLAKIFTMFVQERQALDRSQGGLGLGLSIVRSMVELHGGTIAARSAGRGRGSDFMIRIPAAAAVVDQQTAQRPSDPARRTTHRKIMVVDDNEDAADLLSALLEHLGNTTRVAHDPHTALVLFEEFTPDLAVLDIGLPMMDGYELARRLRARPNAKPIRLVALTGYGQSSDKKRATDAGFDAHLVKPIALAELEAVIERLIS